MKVTTAIALDPRSKVKGREVQDSDIYRLTIRVTYKSVPIYFPIYLKITYRDFKKLSSPHIGERLSELKKQLNDELTRANKIIEGLGTFTFHAFRERFDKKYPQKQRKIVSTTVEIQPSEDVSKPSLTLSTGKNKKYGKRKYDRIRSNVDFEALGPLAEAFGKKIRILEAQERIGTSENYFCSLQSLLAYRKMLRIEDITEEFLFSYERWMLKKNTTLTTIGMYLRNLRAILNLPANKKLISHEDYPFGKGKYQIPSGINVKKALELSDIKKIYDYSPTNSSEFELYARDMWLFGYFSNGINPKDIACLKFNNIHDEFIVIIREKTKYTTRTNPVPIYVAINDDIRRIIKTWGNNNQDPDNYIFPVLEEGISAHRKRELILGFISLINNWMKIIAEKVGINKKVRTMEYRHSSATILRNGGASTEFIKDFLGHQSIKTTQHYLDSFGDATKKEISKKLLAFKELKDDE